MEPIHPTLHPQVRVATDSDMHVIHAWLQAQDTAGVPGTFLCNWNLTEETHSEGKVSVFADAVSDEPLAYQWGGLIKDGIFEVRADCRGQGIGRAFVAHLMAEAQAHNDDILVVHCAPHTSIPFWHRMGFELFGQDRQGDEYGYRILAHPLSAREGAAVSATIEWFPESKRWDPDTPAIASFSPPAVADQTGVIHLQERVHCFDNDFGPRTTNAPVLRIAVNGEEWYCNKARYEEARAFGLIPCSNGYYIDTITRS